MGRRKTTEQFKEELYRLVGDEYSVLGEYINNKEKIEVKHTKCNHIYKVAPSNILRGKKCPNCKPNRRKSTKEFKDELYMLVGDEYSVLDEYITNRLKLKIKHNKCNYIYMTSPRNFLKGSRCPKCFPKGKTTEQFKEEVYDLVGDEYSILDEYINATTKIKIKHNSCGNIFEVFPSNFLKGSRCKKCKKEKDKLLRQGI